MSGYPYSKEGEEESFYHDGYGILKESPFDADTSVPQDLDYDVVGSDSEYTVEPLISSITPAYTPSRSAVDAGDNDFSSDDRPEMTTNPDAFDEVDEPLSGVFLNVNKPLVYGGSGDAGGNDDESELDEDAERGPKSDADFEGFDGEEEGTKGMIADIFGESDAEEEGDFEGFAENEVVKEAAVSSIPDAALVTTKDQDYHHIQGPQGQIESDHDEDNEEEFVSDFDRFMGRRREETRRRRRLGRDEEFLNDSDEIVRETISRMRAAADEDRRLLAKNRPATKKLSMLSMVSNLLIKAGMKSALIENGILSAITDWLSPVSGHTLPSVTIRETFLRHLSEFHIQEPDLLRESGVGKAVMYLYKHPLETRANKRLAGHLINEWSRPIFNLTSDYGSLTREERKQLDLQHLLKRRNITKDVENSDAIQKSSDTQIPLRPGDPGWVNRARVPQPSNKDYVIRPKWNVPADSSAFEDGDEDSYGNEETRDRDGPRPLRRRRVQQVPSSGGASSRIERHIRTLSKNAALRRKARFVRAVPMSVEGRNMSL